MLPLLCCPCAGMEDEARRGADAMHYYAEERKEQVQAGGEEDAGGGGIPERNDFTALDCPGAAGFPAGACLPACPAAARRTAEQMQQLLGVVAQSRFCQCPSLNGLPSWMPAPPGRAGEFELEEDTGEASQEQEALRGIDAQFYFQAPQGPGDKRREEERESLARSALSSGDEGEGRGAAGDAGSPQAAAGQRHPRPGEPMAPGLESEAPPKHRGGQHMEASPQQRHARNPEVSRLLLLLLLGSVWLGLASFYADPALLPRT